MTLRKYALSPRLIAAAAAVVPIVKASKRPELGQRTWALWALWGAGLAVSFLTVREQSARRVSADRR